MKDILRGGLVFMHIMHPERSRNCPVHVILQQSDSIDGQWQHIKQPYPAVLMNLSRGFSRGALQSRAYSFHLADVLPTAHTSQPLDWKSATACLGVLNHHLLLATSSTASTLPVLFLSEAEIDESMTGLNQQMCQIFGVFLPGVLQEDLRVQGAHFYIELRCGDLLHPPSPVRPTCLWPMTHCSTTTKGTTFALSVHEGPQLQDFLRPSP